MNWQQFSKRFLAFVVLLVAISDIVLAVYGGVETTFSRVIATYSDRYPIIAGFAGILVGHLWLPRGKIADRFRRIGENVPIVGIAIGAVLGHLFWPETVLKARILSMWPNAMSLAFVIGILVGHFFWGQPRASKS